MGPLKILKKDQGEVLQIRLSGAVDEDFSFALTDFGNKKKIVVDVGDIDIINSCGCREWIKLMKSLKTDVSLTFINCPKIFIDQVNMLKDFVPAGGKIESFNVPYYCESCEKITSKTFAANDLPNGYKDIPETMVCAHCGKKAEMDVIPNTFFRFLVKRS